MSDLIDVPLDEGCEVCGFVWGSIAAPELIVRLQTVGDGWRTLLESGGAELSQRSDPAVWSVVEYAAHTRDVALNLRDRIVLGLATDNPTPHSLFGDLRIAAGLYDADTPARLSVELPVATNLLARTVAAMDESQLARPIFYPWPRPTTRSLLWVAAQALHEAQHHLDDARALTQ